MTSKLTEAPNSLRIGTKLPSRFEDIVAALPREPSYRITALGTDRYSGRYRLVNVYFIAAVGDDPSNIRKLMTKLGAPERNTFVDGKKIEGTVSFRLHMKTENLAKFYGVISSTIENSDNAYVAAPYHNVVQFSNDGAPDVIFSSNQI